MSSARTMHEEIAEQIMEDCMSNPSAAAVLALWRSRFREGEYDPQRVAWIGQTPWGPGSWPWEQVAAFVKVHTGLMAGLYAYVEVSVGNVPGPDSDRAGNAAKLASVHHQFRAELDLEQNGADCDGWLSWDAPIDANKSSGLGLIASCGTSPVNMGTRIAAGRLPLEVGSTKPSRTFLHLHQDGGVARWAYDDDRIGLLLNVEHTKFRARSADRQAAAQPTAGASARTFVGSTWPPGRPRTGRPWRVRLYQPGVWPGDPGVKPPGIDS